MAEFEIGGKGISPDEEINNDASNRAGLARLKGMGVMENLLLLRKLQLEGKNKIILGLIVAACVTSIIRAMN